MPNKKPYIKLKIFGNWDLVFWENEHKLNDKTFKVLDPVLTRSIKDKEGKWSNQGVPISLNALYRLIAMGAKIKMAEDNYKEEVKNNKEEGSREHQEEDVK